MLEQFLRRRFPYGFLVIICLIIVYLYICFIKLMILDLSNWATHTIVIYLIVYNIIFILEIWSIISTIRTDPGKVPVKWGFSFLRDGERKYCLICHVFKPERTHHCGTCNRCVLNMDHHCPWVNTCIGFKNRKAFILMLWYTILLSLLNILSSLTCIHPILQSLQWKIPQILLITLAFILNIIIFIAILNFFRFHIGLILNNYTTLEILDLKRKGQGDNPPISQFDIGKYYNWKQVFGTSWWMWLLPVFRDSQGPAGDGVLWPKLAAGQGAAS